MSNENQIWTSPVGTIVYMSVNKPAMNRFKGRAEYSCRLEFDGSTSEAQEFKALVESINPNKIVTDRVSKEGNFVVSAASQYMPTVTDADGVELETIPHFTRGSVGKALISVKPAVTVKGGTLYLTGVSILELQLADTTGEDGSSSSTTIDALMAALKKAKS